jgi:hypothetical protein
MLIELQVFAVVESRSHISLMTIVHQIDEEPLDGMARTS